MNSVAVIGGGITGLTAAFYLRRGGIPVTLYEGSSRVGGVVESVRQDGYLAECGPNTILETSPKVAELVDDVGLRSRRLYPAPQAEARYVVRDRRPIEMHGSPLRFFTTPLFTWKAKLALAREPFLPAKSDVREESIAEFVVRRLGQEFLDHAIDALVAGIYAGDPYKLSVPHAFPKLAQMETKYGSLLKGQIFGARERKKRGEIARDRAPKFSFDEGLQVLTDTLADKLGDAVRLNAPVTCLRSSETEKGRGRPRPRSPEEHDCAWTLEYTQNGTLATEQHSAVIYCGTAFQLAQLSIEAAEIPSLKALSEIRYPPVASVVLGFRREDVEHPCNGFGMLIPRVEGFKILGTIFSSALFPNRAPAGHLTLTSYIGGERSPELAAKPAEELVALTCADLQVLLGVRGKPTFVHTWLYPKAIPQYNVGYGRYRGLMADAEAHAPGLFFAGHYRDGISLADSIVSGRNVAERVLEGIRHTQTLAPSTLTPQS